MKATGAATRRRRTGFRGRSGKYLLNPFISGFDPEQNSAADLLDRLIGDGEHSGASQDG